MTNGRLALARLALGPFKVGLVHAPALPSQKPAPAGDAITSLATEWLQRLWELPTPSDKKPTRRA